MEQILPLASQSLHRFLVYANGTPHIKPDIQDLTRTLIPLVAALFSIDEELVPQDRVQALKLAIDACHEALETCTCSRTPLSVLLLAGPIHRRLGEGLTTIVDTLEPLLESMSSVSEDGDNGLISEVRDALTNIKSKELKVLDRRSNRAASLAAKLADCAGNDGGTAAFQCVCQALEEEGLDAGDLRDPERRHEAATSLFELGAAGEAWLEPEEQEVICAVASALLYEEPPEPKQNGSQEGKKEGGASGSPAAGSSAARLLVQKSYLCAITGGLMRDPVSTALGHTYERSAIEKWLAEKDTDPRTGQHLSSKALTPNWTVKAAIDEWLSAAGMTHDQFDEAVDTVPEDGEVMSVERRRG